MVSCPRLGVPLLVGVALALGVLGPASARTPAPPKYGGTLVVGLRGGDPVLDPTLATAASASQIYGAMCQQLYDRDANQQFVPVLAAALPAISKDKLSYTVQLRKGIKFNDGTPFNAQAVVTTVQRYITYPGSLPRSRYLDVDSVTATGPYTVVYHLKARDSAFIAGNTAYILSPTQLAKLGDNFSSNPICVGPFMFDHRVVGDHVTVIKSPYYYDKANVFLDRIVYKPMSDAPAAAAALKAGDIQALDNVSTTELDGVRQTSSLQVISAPQLGWLGLFINIGNKNGQGNLPYTNVGTPLASSAKLRQAFEEAIDRNTLNRVVFSGLYQPSCTLFPPAFTTWYEAIKVPCTPYDPKHAAKLVAESGFPNPTVRLLTDNSTDRLRLAAFIQAQEAAVGINVVIESFDSPTFNARLMSGNFDASLGGRAPGGDDPSVVYASLATVPGNTNRSGYSNPRMDYVLKNGLKATDPKARAVNYHVAQQIIQSDRPYIVLYNPTTFAAFSTKLTGVRLTANGLLAVANARYK